MYIIYDDGDYDDDDDDHCNDLRDNENILILKECKLVLSFPPLLTIRFNFISINNNSLKKITIFSTTKI